MKRVLLQFLAVCSLATAAQAQNTTNFPHLGEVIRLDPALDKLLAKDAVIEVLGSGFDWSEGPVWVKEGDSGFALFSDVPRNHVLKWELGKGISEYMKPSGYTGVGGYGGEPGSNGLTLDSQGQLVLCEHGDRRVSVLTKNGGKRTIADNYQGKRFNSPNDLCFKSSGELYFTDPPYGLPNGWDSPLRELDVAGVYRVEMGKDGHNKVSLIVDDMTRPNGIAFSPDEKTLYVAQSDPKASLWKKFPVKADGTVGKGEVLFDTTEYVGKHKGLPDGMKTDKDGNIWATGPGGVWIISPAGKPLGRIDTKEANGNCTWGDDGSTLYITADMYFVRIRTLTKGAGW